MGAGKTELARYMATAHGYRCLSSSELCRTISRLIFHDERRDHLNKVGDLLRRIDENIWVKALLTPDLEGRRVVVDSVRYLSEALFLRNSGFEIWRVSVSDEIRQQRLDARKRDFASEQQHASETELDEFDYDFVFDSTGLSFDLVDDRLRER
jgi:dephospho-CoA kinase